MMHSAHSLTVMLASEIFPSLVLKLMDSLIRIDLRLTKHHACPFKPPDCRFNRVVSMAVDAWRWGARCSSVVRAFAHGAMGLRIDPSWGGPIELFFSFKPVLHDWRNKGCGMYYPVCGTLYKRTLAANRKE